METIVISFIKYSFLDLGSMSRKSLFMGLLAVAFCLSPLIGCGGGTTGSSSTIVTKKISGKVLENSGAPVVGATVTAIASGDSGVTDNNGQFEFTTELTDEPQKFLVRSKDGRQATVTQVFPGVDGDITFTVLFDKTLVTSFKGLSLEVTLGGACENNFYTFYELAQDSAERQIEKYGAFVSGFDQLGDIRIPVECSYQGRLLKDGEPVRYVNWEIRTGGCKSKSRAESSSFIEELDSRKLLSRGQTSGSGEFDAKFLFEPKPGECNWSLSFTDDLPVKIAILAYSKLEIEGF